MNIVNRLTLRCLKLNKRRTLVTIIGIILSVAMLTAISTIFFSFMDLMQRDTIANPASGMRASTAWSRRSWPRRSRRKM